MRIFACFACFVLIAVGASAQQPGATASAAQSVELLLAPSIDIRFSGTGTNAGGTISMVFDDVSKFEDGVVSSAQELEVRTNRTFKISVQTGASTFTYVGPASNAAMPVNNRLFLTLTGNNTGGNIASGFDSYKSLSATTQELLLNGERGDERKFMVTYKAKPDFDYPAGAYTVDVLYTATQP